MTKAIEYPTRRSTHERQQLAGHISRRILEGDTWFTDLVVELDQLAVWREKAAGPPPALATSTLRHVNTVIRDRQDIEAVAAALTTAQVIDKVRGLNSRASVHARVERGQLLSFKAANGRTNLFPAWQFHPRIDTTIPITDDLATICRERFDGDAAAFDIMIRSPLERLDGRSIADLLHETRWTEAVMAANVEPEQDG